MAAQQVKPKRPLIILTGPTAAGKTALSIELAKAVDGEIISADSIQIYRYMDIGSAKIRPEEMQGVPHHLIDELDPEEEFSCFRFAQMAKERMEEIYERKHIPILVGGTGFYIQAVLYDVHFSQKDTDHSYHQVLENTLEEMGPVYLHAYLAKVDPVSAKLVHPNNVKRVMRALEYFHDTGQPISEHNEQERQNTSPYAFVYNVLTMDREKLYERINHRVDLMMEEGLEEEVKGLLEKGYSRDLPSMHGLGYREMVSYLSGELTREEAVELIKRNTRHFAKRQLTWFRREKQVNWINLDENHDQKDILELMIRQVQEIQKGTNDETDAGTDKTNQKTNRGRGADDALQGGESKDA